MTDPTDTAVSEAALTAMATRPLDHVPSTSEYQRMARELLRARSALADVGEKIELPLGIKSVEPQRLNEILSGYSEFPQPDMFEVRALAYEVRNWRMKQPRPAAEEGRVSKATTLGGLLLDAARNGDCTASPELMANMHAKIGKYFALPLQFIEPHDDHAAPILVDANGNQVASLYWPIHPRTETEEAEQATCELGRAFVSALSPAAHTAQAENTKITDCLVRQIVETRDAMRKVADDCNKALNTYASAEQTARVMQEDYRSISLAEQGSGAKDGGT